MDDLVYADCRVPSRICARLELRHGQVQRHVGLQAGLFRVQPVLGALDAQVQVLDSIAVVEAQVYHALQRHLDRGL